jgi:hypothetical protein
MLSPPHSREAARFLPVCRSFNPDVAALRVETRAAQSASLPPMFTRSRQLCNTGKPNTETSMAASTTSSLWVLQRSNVAYCAHRVTLRQGINSVDDCESRSRSRACRRPCFRRDSNTSRQ